MNTDFAAAHISFIALHRMVENQAAADPKCRLDLEKRGKPLLSHARTLTDEALLEKLHQAGITLDKNSYTEIAEYALSSEEISKTVVTAEVRAQFRERFQEDWVWLALTVLWERWFPQWPNFEQLDDQIQAGYARLKNSSADACEHWLPAWKHCLQMFDKGKFKTIAEFDGLFRGTQFVSNWLGDLEMELGNAARTDSKWHAQRIQFCEEFLWRFPDEDELTRANIRRAQAEGTFGAGNRASGDALYEQWLKADPQWGWGWIGWADNYSICATGSNRDLPRAEALLKQGLDVADVLDREDLLERLSSLYTDQGRQEEAAALEAERAAIRSSEAGLFSKTNFIFDEADIRPAQPPAAPPPPAKSQKIGRNEPCPCGSGKKYKKCCLSKDETAAREAARTAQAAVIPQRYEPPIQALPIQALPPVTSPDFLTDLLPELNDMLDPLPPETRRRLDELWNAFDALSKPTPEQIDTLLGALLELPADATEWNDLFHLIARAGHPDLPTVFRRIAGNVAHTPDAGLAFFYWAAAEEFIRHGHSLLLPEVAAEFRKLNQENYDADALCHLMDWLLSEGFETETLALAEHFLPILRGDDELLYWTVPEVSNLILELRASALLRDDTSPEPEVERLTEELCRNLEEDIPPDAARTAAAVIANRSRATPWNRAEFELVFGDIDADKNARAGRLRMFGALVQVAREAWRFEQRSPGGALRGLILMLNSVCDELNAEGKKPQKTPRNLLDYLLPDGLEARLVSSCLDLISINVARVRLILDAHDTLLRFATRHQLLSEPHIARSRPELDRLRKVLEGAM